MAHYSHCSPIAPPCLGIRRSEQGTLRAGWRQPSPSPSTAPLHALSGRGFLPISSALLPSGQARPGEALPGSRFAPSLYETGQNGSERFSTARPTSRTSRRGEPAALSSPMRAPPLGHLVGKGSTAATPPEAGQKGPPLIQPFQTTLDLRAAHVAFLPPQTQHLPGESPRVSPLLRRPTCVQHPSKDPALPVADRPEARALPFAQDVHAARPAAGALPPGVIPTPVSLQDAVVIVAVHLGGGRGTKRSCCGEAAPPHQLHGGLSASWCSSGLPFMAPGCLEDCLCPATSDHP